MFFFSRQKTAYEVRISDWSSDVCSSDLTNRNSSRNLANINSADIDQIEVLRGSSAIYGSGAAGGIVSIRTRQPNGETRAETTVSALTPLSRLGASDRKSVE